MEFKNTLIYQFIKIAIDSRNQLQRSLSEVELNNGQIFLLISLWDNDGQSQIDLANNLRLSPPSINKMVKGLVSNDFVRTEKSEKDSRVTKIYLTEKGLGCRISVVEKWENFDNFFFSALTDTDKLIMMQLFEKLSNNIYK